MKKLDTKNRSFKSVLIVVINFYLLNSCIDSKAEKNKINFSKFFTSTNHFFKDLNTEKLTFTFVEQKDVISDTTAFYNFLRKIILTYREREKEFVHYGVIAHEAYHWVYEVPDRKLSLKRKFDLLFLLSLFHENTHSKDAYIAYVDNLEFHSIKSESTNRALMIPLIGKYYNVQQMANEIFDTKNLKIPVEYKDYFIKSGYLLSLYKNKKMSKEKLDDLVFQLQSEVRYVLWSKRFNEEYKNLALQIIPI